MMRARLAAMLRRWARELDPPRAEPVSPVVTCTMSGRDLVMVLRAYKRGQGGKDLGLS